jgi:alkanesulfonate monooxygenase SsuD/methylene tetrahydromethanopterin reductase-like flavin-dependent oxidoreductase (luciferase family)
VKRRFELLEQRVSDVRQMWEDGRATPPPVQDPFPMWLGVMGPRGARMAGRLGAGLLWLGAKLMEPYREGLEEGGHDPAVARCAGLASLFVADDPEAAWPRVRPYLQYQRDSYARYGAEGRDDSEPAGTKALSADNDDPTFAVVTPEQAIDRMRRWLGELPVADVFMWESIAGMPDDLADRHVELVSSVVAPALADVGLPVG